MYLRAVRKAPSRVTAPLHGQGLGPRVSLQECQGHRRRRPVGVVLNTWLFLCASLLKCRNPGYLPLRFAGKAGCPRTRVNISSYLKPTGGARTFLKPRRFALRGRRPGRLQGEGLGLGQPDHSGKSLRHLPGGTQAPSTELAARGSSLCAATADE